MAAASADVQAWRILGATAYGDAVAVVTLTETHNISARASGSASAQAALAPTIIRAGYVQAQATAFGLAAVLRAVSGEASDDATASGEAIAADALGYSDETATATAVQAAAHVIHPGQSDVFAYGEAEGDGIVTRSCPVVGAAAANGFGQASMRLSGDSYYRHDGFVSAAGTCTAVIDNERMAITAMFGAFTFAESSGSANTFIRYQGGAIAPFGASTGTGAASRTTQGQANGQAVASADVGFVATIPGFASGAASATGWDASASQQFATSASGSCAATSSASAGGVVRQVWATAQATATATDVQWAEHQFGEVDAVAGGDGSGSGVYTKAGEAFGVGTSTFSAVTAEHHRCGSFGVAAVTPGLDQWLTNYTTFATAIGVGGVSWSVEPTLYLNHKAAAVGVGVAAFNATASIWFGRTAAGVATCTGSATAFSNVDVLAPDERRMTVGADPRGMVVSFDNRTMIVSA